MRYRLRTRPGQDRQALLRVAGGHLVRPGLVGGRGDDIPWATVEAPASTDTDAVNVLYDGGSGVTPLSAQQQVVGPGVDLILSTDLTGQREQAVMALGRYAIEQRVRDAKGQVGRAVTLVQRVAPMGPTATLEVPSQIFTDTVTAVCGWTVSQYATPATAVLVVVGPSGTQVIPVTAQGNVAVSLAALGEYDFTLTVADRFGQTAQDTATCLREAIPDGYWYKIVDGESPTIIDYGPNAKHAYLYSGASVTGNGTLLSTAANQPTVNTASHPSSLRAYPCTVSVWLKATIRADKTANSFAFLPFPANAVSNDYPGEGGFGIGLNIWSDGGGGSALAINHGDEEPEWEDDWSKPWTNIGSGTFQPGVWYHCAARWTSTTTDVFVNGAKVYSGGAAPNLLSSRSVPFFLSRHNNDTGYGTKRFFQGEVQDARWWTRVRTDAEIQAIYEAGPV